MPTLPHGPSSRPVPGTEFILRPEVHLRRAARPCTGKRQHPEREQESERSGVVAWQVLGIIADQPQLNPQPELAAIRSKSLPGRWMRTWRPRHSCSGPPSFLARPFQACPRQASWSRPASLEIFYWAMTVNVPRRSTA